MHKTCASPSPLHCPRTQWCCRGSIGALDAARADAEAGRDCDHPRQGALTALLQSLSCTAKSSRGGGGASAGAGNGAPLLPAVVVLADAACLFTLYAPVQGARLRPRQLSAQQAAAGGGGGDGGGGDSRGGDSRGGSGSCLVKPGEVLLVALEHAPGLPASLTGPCIALL